MTSPDVSAKVPILLVDDHADSLLALTAMFQDPGWELVTARNGPEALRKALLRDYALMVLDVVMPGMDGFEVATLIKQRATSRHVPIIFLTAASVHPSLRYVGYGLGAVDYLQKPLEPDVIRAKVGVFAELYRKNRQVRDGEELLHSTEKHMRELELERIRNEGARRYRNLAESIPQIVWTALPDGSFDYLNRRWRDRTGRAAEESRGKDWLLGVDEEYRNEVRRSWEAALTNREAFESECCIRGCWFLLRGVPETGHDGNVTGWIGTFTDIDAQKRAQSALETAVKLRDEFLSIGSHELRTPLTALQLSLDSLSRGIARAGHASGPLVARLSVASKSVARLGALVDTLLDVTRLSRGKIKLRREDLDFTDVARDVVERLSSEARRLGTRLSLEGVPVRGYWDRVRVEQVLTNLISNAIKFGLGKPVDIRIADDGDHVRVIVEDHGMGIAPADLERIFGRFERTSTASAYSGLGLGLYITERLVTAKGGTISVKSTLGEGSTFEVLLPRNIPRMEDARELVRADEANSPH